MILEIRYFILSGCLDYFRPYKAVFKYAILYVNNISEEKLYDINSKFIPYVTVSLL